ncbi:MAG: hypothetical protein ABIJ00_13920 [Candidatus Eisenbacteria bacterium]
MCVNALRRATLQVKEDLNRISDFMDQDGDCDGKVVVTHSLFPLTLQIYHESIDK